MIRIHCVRCQEWDAEFDYSESAIPEGIVSYMGHMIEMHWDEVRAARKLIQEHHDKPQLRALLDGNI